MKDEKSKINVLEDIGLSTVKTLLAARTIPVNKRLSQPVGLPML